MRDSGGVAGSKILAAVFDISDGSPKFVGLIPNKTKLAYRVSPGSHKFMVYCPEAADFMDAEVAGGKEYFVMVLPHVGSLTWRFSFRPVRSHSIDEFGFGSTQFERWRKDTESIEVTPAAFSWSADNQANVLDNMHEYLPRWNSKPPQARASQTLNASDHLNGG